jgi:hypothetical protein
LHRIATVTPDVAAVDALLFGDGIEEVDLMKLD